VDRSREGCQYNSNPDDGRTQRLITYGSRILSIVVKPGICLPVSPPDAQPTTVGVSDVRGACGRKAASTVVGCGSCSAMTTRPSAVQYGTLVLPFKLAPAANPALNQISAALEFDYVVPA